MTKKHIFNYLERLSQILMDKSEGFDKVHLLISALSESLSSSRSVYLCGNGGSAANAIHIANDLIYGAGLGFGRGLNVEALSANPSILTCLANDIGYEKIYSEQLRVKGKKGDVLIALSGSGNSPNILEAIKVANHAGLKTFAILGFDGGKAKELAQIPIHFSINDMQIAEDLQLIVGHICMQWLCENPPIAS